MTKPNVTLYLILDGADKAFIISPDGYIPDVSGISYDVNGLSTPTLTVRMNASIVVWQGEFFRELVEWISATSFSPHPRHDGRALPSDRGKSRRSKPIPVPLVDVLKLTDAELHNVD